MSDLTTEAYKIFGVDWANATMAVFAALSFGGACWSAVSSQRSALEARYSRQVTKAELLLPHFEIIDELIDYAVRRNGRAHEITPETKDKCKKSIKSICYLINDKNLNAYLQELREFLVPLKDYETMYDKTKQGERNALRTKIKEGEAAYEDTKTKHLNIG